MDDAPGFASPYHVHHEEDAAFYVLEGEVAFVCGGKWLTAGPGAYVFGPREILHGFKVVGSEPARMLLLCTPAGFEHFVLELATEMDAPPTPPDMAEADGHRGEIQDRHSGALTGLNLRRPPGMRGIAQ